MAKTFKHLSFHDRLVIAVLLKQGYRKSEIARELKVHRSTITRELRRNLDNNGVYDVFAANQLAHKRLLDQKLRKIERRPHVKEYVVEKLKEGWSPEQIVGRLKLLSKSPNLPTLTSHESIYAYIYSKEGIKEKLYQYLKSKRRRRYPRIARSKRTLIPNRDCIYYIARKKISLPGCYQTA